MHAIAYFVSLHILSLVHVFVQGFSIFWAQMFMLHDLHAVMHIICCGSGEVNRTSVRSYCVFYSEEHTLGLMTGLCDPLAHLINETSSSWLTCVNNSYFPEFICDYGRDQPSSGL